MVVDDDRKGIFLLEYFIYQGDFNSYQLISQYHSWVFHLKWSELVSSCANSNRIFHFFSEFSFALHFLRFKTRFANNNFPLSIYSHSSVTNITMGHSQFFIWYTLQKHQVRERKRKGDNITKRRVLFFFKFWCLSTYAIFVLFRYHKLSLRHFSMGSFS